MKLGIRDIDWSYVGALLAQESDIEQIEFFKSFVKECNTWGTKHQIQLQLAIVNQKLTIEEKETLSMIGYIE